MTRDADCRASLHVHCGHTHDILSLSSISIEIIRYEKGGFNNRVRLLINNPEMCHCLLPKNVTRNTSSLDY